MLRKSLGIVAGAAFLTGLGAVASQPSYAQSIQFSCVMDRGLPTTVARNTATGNSLPVVRWYSEYFSGSGYDPVTRCQQVSGRFQSARNSGRLNYITAGVVNGLPVVCATNAGGRCDGSNVLFTLKPGQNAADSLQRLFDVRDLGAGPLYESGGRQYIDVAKMLAPLEAQAGSEPAAPSLGGEVQPTTPAQPSGGNF
ncbi:COP23 domain-containing protein [Oscillatoria amoena NRMC-F 0135]|uniref:COP23 domain-containing protein n=1 Tax=Geitlerinema calcuttense NRMC-F 0142 TaxID=2922238 RepID=A0ABT7LWD6_9CYAN|nr:COP23 domain-containing protein [Geitlerinema calcuttense]MDL5045181.1 COP23 domain-containing protein [Oscillatoria amoena NRMC-F 0135]MDL5056334.1 COP23 domain-containing protein [Geitlerinema calcuttense NRMC-F 0142]